MNKMYLINYTSYDECYTQNIFVTDNKLTAIAYVDKFNNILNRYKEYYKQFEGNDGWIKDEVIDAKFERWYFLRNTHHCFYEEIPVR